MGGLYGIAIGRVFFGESMFARVTDASKVAFVALVTQLRRWGFDLIDCQQQTRHLATFGARAIPRTDFLARLARLTGAASRQARWTLDADLIEATDVNPGPERPISRLEGSNVTAISAWRCPKCGRSVPRTVDVCRCGHQRSGNEESATIGSPEAPVAPPVVTSRPAPSRGPSTLLLMAVALAAGVGGAYVFLRPTPSPPAAASAPTPGETPQPTEATASGDLKPGEPQWPSDPTLFTQATPTAKASTAAPANTAASAPASPRSVEDVVSGAIPAVVLVDTTEGRGTGFFVSNDTVITNAHVVDGATYVTLRGGAGDQTPAMVTSRNTDLDLAVLHVSKAKAGQPVLALGSSGDVRVGQEIVAIGSPMGLQNTVTRGIVSSLRRVGQVTLIQTDAAINPGNSGGPLLDHNGRVVAVATMKLTGQAESLGFGVAAEHVRAMLDGSAPASSGHRMVDSMNTNATASDPDAERNDATEGYAAVHLGSGQESRPDRSVVGDARRAMPFRPWSVCAWRPRLVRHLGRLRRQQGVGRLQRLLQRPEGCRAESGG